VPPPAPPRPGPAEGTEELLEDVGEAAEALLIAAEAAIADAGVAETIVGRALVVVRQHLVGLADLLEAVRRLRIGVDVRVILARQPAVLLLELVFGYRPGDFQDFVVIAFRSHK